MGKKKYGLDATAMGDEGGFAPNFQNNGEALELLVEAIKKSGYEGKIMIVWTLLPASSSRRVNMTWTLRTQRPRRRTGSHLTSYWRCTRDSSRTTLLSVLRTPLIRMTGKAMPS